MKRFLTLLLCAISLLPALSAGRSPKWAKENNPIFKGEVSEISLNGKNYKLGEIHGMPLATKAGNDDVIYEAKGEVKLYNKYSVGTAVFNNTVYQYADDFPGTIVWGENDEVYILDILSTAATGTYVKGTLSGNRITVNTGQVLEWYPEEGYGIQLVVLETRINGDKVDFYYAPDINKVEFIVTDNGSITMSLPGKQFDGNDPPQYVLSITYTDEPGFLGVSDYTQKYEPTGLTLVEMPKDAEVVQYVYLDEFGYASLVNVAFYNSDLYIQGLSSMLPEAVLKATVNGDSALISQDEYLGIYFDQFFIFTKVLYDNPDYDEEDYESSPYILAPSNVGFPLQINREESTISANQEGIYLSLQPDEDISNSIGVFGTFELTYQESAAGTPVNPYNLVYTTEYSAQGFNDFMFTLSNYSVEGRLLDTETLYYRIFVDGEPLIFEEEVGYNLQGKETVMYYGVPGQQRYMVFGFMNGEDIYKFSETEFDIGIYVEGVTTVGVQAIYIYEGKVTQSQLVTLNVETGEITQESGVEQISSSPVVKTQRYTLNGLKADSNAKGILIEKQIHADGTVTAKKILNH